ncbi:hypothetical protein [Stenotrophomonas sp. S39]|uniref:hypothetical protein n=1 Tax=Stenotrophomonas sp. S39 TaxID=2767451 RepID=UPI00190AFBD8|nr:hypothetical protein [Stenotrophomonas sp. S39]MBK0054335.1 hypothetical protein [Stenotrophomonas sp. S39]
MVSNKGRFKRPIRFNRTRANPIQRLPFYRQSHARAGDYWRMPEAHGHLMGREVGRVCCIAFLQAIGEAVADPRTSGSAHLADIVCSLVEAYGGSLGSAERGIVEGFFGPGSPLRDVLLRGLESKKGADYTMEQLEEALSDLASVTVEEYASRRPPPIQSIIPDRTDHPPFALSGTTRLLR